MVMSGATTASVWYSRPGWVVGACDDVWGTNGVRRRRVRRVRRGDGSDGVRSSGGQGFASDTASANATIDELVFTAAARVDEYAEATPFEPLD